MNQNLNLKRGRSKHFCFVDVDSSFLSSVHIRSDDFVSAALYFCRLYHFRKVLVIQILDQFEYDFKVIDIFTFNRLLKIISKNKEQDKFEQKCIFDKMPKPTD